MWDGLQAVPAIDSVSNLDSRDVVGNKNDTHFSDSLSGHAHNTNDHFHRPSLLWPTLAPAILITSKNIAWTLGDNFATIVAADDITEPFDIHWIHFDAISAQGAYEVHLYYGAGDIEIARIPFVKAAQQDGLYSTQSMTPIIPANSQVRAKLASDNAAADTANIKIRYHTY